MTSEGVYIRIVDSTNPPHWLPHLVLDSLLLQDISYHTYVNGVVASLHPNKKGLLASNSIDYTILQNRKRQTGQRRSQCVILL